MSEPTVLVNFRLDRENPVRFRWRAKDGTPGDGYKAQVTAVLLADGTRLAMDGSSIIEQTQPYADSGAGAYTLTFNGMVGYPVGHPLRARIDRLEEEPIDYDLEFVRDDGHVAVPEEDYQILARPLAIARKLAPRDA